MDDDQLHPHGRVDRRAVGGHRRRDGQEPAPGGRAGARHAAVASATSPTASPPTSSPTACRRPRWPSGPAPTTRSSSPACATTSARPISVPNHPAIAAEILKPYVRPEVYTMIRVHQDFQGRHYYAPLRRRPRRPRASTATSSPPRSGRSPSSSPTSGTRSPSTPTTTRCRSSTSSRMVRQVFAAAQDVPPPQQRRLRATPSRSLALGRVGAGQRLGLVEEPLERRRAARR